MCGCEEHIKGVGDFYAPIGDQLLNVKQAYADGFRRVGEASP